MISGRPYWDISFLHSWTNPGWPYSFCSSYTSLARDVFSSVLRWKRKFSFLLSILSCIERHPNSDLRDGVGTECGTANKFLNIQFCNSFSLVIDPVSISTHVSELFKRDGTTTISKISNEGRDEHRMYNCLTWPRLGKS